MSAARRVAAAVAAVAGALALLAAASAPAAAAARVGAVASLPVPSVAVTLDVRPVTAAGEVVVVHARTARARWCVVSAVPAVPGFGARLDCSHGTTFRVAHLPPVPGPAARRFVFSVAAIGPSGRRVARKAVVERPFPRTVAPLAVSTAGLPPATVGVGFSTALAATGGTAPYRWSVTSGVLPAGLTLAPDGTIAGTPTAAGTFAFGVEVLDSEQPAAHGAAAALSITVALPPSGVTYTTNWAGYEVSGGPFTAVTGTFVVPGVAASPGGTLVAEWVGVDGASNTSLIQAGVEEAYDPASGTVTVDAWWEILPAFSTPIDMTVSIGDQVTVTIGEVTAATWQITLADVTTGQSFSTVQAYDGPGASAEWIVEAPTSGSGAQFTLGAYGPPVSFTGLRITGTELALTADVMMQGTAPISVPSVYSANGFAVAYGGTAPPPP
ncbi:MAG TPA: G1 family glutamic endopeptidase [Acidimicrobiales bacterium]|nr:G1 family glutamic endopeptidase [Acidimicrobiales bacterium]